MLYKIINSAFGGNVDSYNDNTVFVELPDWDSMGHMLFITQIEKGFDIDLTGDEIASIRNIGDIKRVLILKGKENL